MASQMGVICYRLFLLYSNCLKSSETISVEYNTDWETTLISIMKKWLENNPDVKTNHSYAVMFQTSGTITSTMTGTVNVTGTAVRFFVAYNDYIFSGTYSKSSQSITALRSIQSEAG